MKIISWCVGMFRYYVVFSKSILFIIGLIFSYKLVEKTFFDILITHLNDEWEDLRKSVIVVNLREGAEAVVQILFAFLADAYTGLFKMVVCSTTIYITGLSLSCFAAWRDEEDSLDLGVFYPALLLMTLSHAALKAVLPSFLGDQLVRKDGLSTEEEEERAQKRSNFWLNTVSFLAAIVALFGLSQIDPLKVLTMVLAIAMGTSFLWFLLGTKLYKHVEPTGSPLSDVVFVLHNAIVKRDIEYPDRIPPHISWLRWLDRAAVDIYTVEDVKGVKYLIKMVPMWTTFLRFSLVAASGSTFFLEEATSIADDVRILLFIVLQRFTEFMVSQISDYLLEKLCKNKGNIAQRMMLVRIGIGMIFCPLCCITAWINARHRLHLTKIFTVKDLRKHMSVFRLTPQFILLAVMEGLSGDGLENFFDSQVSRSISRYGPSFGECVMGVGKFLSVVCILILSRWFNWFKKTVTDSELDKYYALLAGLGCVNFVVYCFVAHWYGDDRFLPRNKVDLEMAGSVLTDHIQVDILGNSVARTLSGKGRYSQKSLSSRIVPIQEESSVGDSVTETGQETSELPDNKHNDDVAEKNEPGVIGSMDQVSTLASESTMNGPSDGPMLGVARSFPHALSKGIHKRSSSMRRSLSSCALISWRFSNW